MDCGTFDHTFTGSHKRLNSRLKFVQEWRIQGKHVTIATWWNPQSNFSFIESNLNANFIAGVLWFTTSAFHTVHQFNSIIFPTTPRRFFLSTLFSLHIHNTFQQGSVYQTSVSLLFIHTHVSLLLERTSLIKLTVAFAHFIAGRECNHGFRTKWATPCSWWLFPADYIKLCCGNAKPMVGRLQLQHGQQSWSVAMTRPRASNASVR